jgi:hypothetical protein
MATILIVVVIIAALVAGWFLLNSVARKRVTERHGSIEDAMSDEREPLPSAHLIPDNETPAGDTPEAHDEVNPHDIPPGHPGRRAAEDQADAGDDEERTTRGDDELAQAPPSREERLEPRSGERR